MCTAFSSIFFWRSNVRSFLECLEITKVSKLIVAIVIMRTGNFPRRRRRRVSAEVVNYRGEISEFPKIFAIVNI